MGADQHWRIQEYILGVKPIPPIESWGRSPNRGCEAPDNRGRSQSRGCEAPMNWERSPNWGQSPSENGGRGLGKGLGAPPQNFFEKSNLKPFFLVQIWSKYLKQITWFEGCVQLFIFMGKSTVIIICEGNMKFGRGLWDTVPRRWSLFWLIKSWFKKFWC